MILVFTQVIDERARRRARGGRPRRRTSSWSATTSSARSRSRDDRPRDDAGARAGGARAPHQRRPPRGGEAGVRERPGCSHLAEGRPVAGRRRRRLRRRGGRRGGADPDVRRRAAAPRPARDAGEHHRDLRDRAEQRPGAEPRQGHASARAGWSWRASGSSRSSPSTCRAATSSTPPSPPRSPARSARPTSGLRRDAAPPGRGQADARRRGGQVPDGDVRQPAAQAHGR